MDFQYFSFLSFMLLLSLLTFFFPLTCVFGPTSLSLGAGPCLSHTPRGPRPHCPGLAGAQRWVWMCEQRLRREVGGGSEYGPHAFRGLQVSYWTRWEYVLFQ